MASGTASGRLEVGGRRLNIRNLDRAVFPHAGTTKGELLDYYVGIADAMLPHLRDRLLHMHRYSEGVEGPHFWQKGCPEHRPEWLPAAPVWSRDKQANIDFCVVNEAGLLWAVNMGSIELHTSLHRRHDLQRPTVVAFDLDPGEGVGLLECCDVALHFASCSERWGCGALPRRRARRAPGTRAAQRRGVVHDDEAGRAGGAVVPRSWRARAATGRLDRPWEAGCSPSTSGNAEASWNSAHSPPASPPAASSSGSGS